MLEEISNQNSPKLYQSEEKWRLWKHIEWQNNTEPNNTMWEGQEIFWQRKKITKNDNSILHLPNIQKVKEWFRTCASHSISTNLLFFFTSHNLKTQRKVILSCYILFAVMFHDTKSIFVSWYPSHRSPSLWPGETSSNASRNSGILLLRIPPLTEWIITFLLPNRCQESFHRGTAMQLEYEVHHPLPSSDEVSNEISFTSAHTICLHDINRGKSVTIFVKI
jgi:hypothetical protein